MIFDCEIIVGSIDDLDGPPQVLSTVIQECVIHNPHKPVLNPGPFALVKVFVGFDEGLLSNILGFIFISAQPCGELNHFRKERFVGSVKFRVIG